VPVIAFDPSLVAVLVVLFVLALIGIAVYIGARTKRKQ